MVKSQSGGMFDADWNIAQEGDTIILFEGHNQVKFLKLEANSQYNSRRGNYDHNDFIGKPFGTNHKINDLRAGKNFQLCEEPVYFQEDLRKEKRKRNVKLLVILSC